jgi:hypothetical protein
VKLLKQSTAVTIKLGPFLDATDAVTPETGLTISQSDVLLSKNYGTFAQKNDATTCTNDGTHGWYGVPLNTTDTNTLGLLQISVNESGAGPVWDWYMVVNSNFYNAYVLGTEYYHVNARAVNDSTAAAINLGASALGIVRGTSDNTGFTGTTTQFEASDITEATTSHYVGRVIVFTSGALLGQATLITAYSLVGGRGHFTVSLLTEAVPNTSSFVIV